MGENNQNQEKSFIKEKIKEKPRNKRRLLSKLAWVVLSAVLFGVIACATFVALKPKLEEWLYPDKGPDNHAFLHE